MTDALGVFRPASVVNHKAALLSLLGAVLVISVFKWWGSHNGPFCLITVAVFIALPHVWSVLALWDKSAAASEFQQEKWQRFGVKLFGQLGLFAALALAYFIFQGFSENYLMPLSGLAGEFGLLLVVATPVYLGVTDQHMAQPKDGLYQIGRLLLGNYRSADKKVVRQYLMGWIVKGFFAPLMAGFALNDMNWFLDLSISHTVSRAADVYEASYRMIYFIDVMFAFTGYLCTFRLLDTQIRSTEPTMSGWVVCLLCYPPFWNLVYKNFLNYEEGYYWGDWLSSSSPLWFVWAALIILSTIVYVWATISFGIRFSNLTNRGILTNGPYRWMKHPAYVSKNVSWWLIAVPFFSNSGFTTIIRDCAALGLLNVVYYLRAKTEEQHLRSDTDYVAYSAWMETNSLYWHLKKIVVKHSRQLSETSKNNSKSIP